MRIVIALIVLIGLAVAGASQAVTLYVIPPIGMLPEGGTAVIWRTGQLRFVDSPDAMCLRNMGGFSLLCRGSAIAAVNADGILFRLPYIDALYRYSLDGRDVIGTGATSPAIPSDSEVLRRLNQRH